MTTLIQEEPVSQPLTAGTSLRVQEDAPRDLHVDVEATTEMARDPQRKTFSRLIILPSSSKKPRYLQEKEWLGMVTAVDEVGFTARLKDYRRGPDLETSFLFEEIPQEDLDLVQLGSEFYWSLGYRIEPNGQRLRYSLVHFRRLPKWTAQKLTEARQRARDVLRSLDSELDGTT